MPPSSRVVRPRRLPQRQLVHGGRRRRLRLGQLQRHAPPVAGGASCADDGCSRRELHPEQLLVRAAPREGLRLFVPSRSVHPPLRWTGQRSSGSRSSSSLHLRGMATSAGWSFEVWGPLSGDWLDLLRPERHVFAVVHAARRCLDRRVESRHRLPAADRPGCVY